MLVEKSIQIIGGKKLTGTIEVSGAKNAVLKQMILPILSEGVYKIENVPNIADVYYMQEVLDVLGITSKLDGKTLEINSPSDISVEAPYEVVQKMRASIIVLGPLLARKGEACSRALSRYSSYNWTCYRKWFLLRFCKKGIFYK